MTLFVKDGMEFAIFNREQLIAGAVLVDILLFSAISSQYWDYALKINWAK